jgi:arylsulfatase A-like enzyme
MILLVILFTTISCSQFSRQKAPRQNNEDRQAQAPSFATHNFEPLYRATERKQDDNKARRPNILFILTDDQDVELGSLKFMPKLAEHMSSEGATFSHGFSSTPMCCPSRSSLLTGLYVHNHAVYTNNDNCSSTYWVKEHEPRTFATYLQDSGYSTAYFGKYLNKYTGSHVPAGWGEWQGLVRNSRFYNYTLNVNGVLHHHGFNYQKDYLPDIITNRSMNFLRWSLNTSPETPVMATLSYPGPHGPEDSAPQYADLFHNVTTHHTPAYDLAPNPDKQWILRETGKMAPIQRRFTDVLMTKRLQTLQSIDEGVEKVVKLLKELGQLDNTYIFYTSDHGYHLGQYGLVKGKAFPFDVDTKVPMIVRGPGVPRNTRFNQPLVNIDLAPTFLDAAGLNPPPHMDGRSILDIFRSKDEKPISAKPWRDAFLIERGKMTFERYMKVSSLANSTLLLNDHLTKRERVEIECKKPRYQLPCEEGQKWFCKERRTDGAMKMRRCPAQNNKCQCRAGDVIGWKYAKQAAKDVLVRRHRKLPPKERSNQKDFLRKHVNKADKIKARFLKEMRNQDLTDGALNEDLDDALAAVPGLRRWRRSRNTDDGFSDRWRRESDHEDASFDGMLQDVADQEIREVDGMVEDLAAEIRILHKYSNSSSSDPMDDDILGMEDNLSDPDDDLLANDDNCLLNRNNVLCSAQDLSRSELSWEKSRLAVKHQIQRLRAQLHELKQIRRYLHVRRPAKNPRKPRYHLRSMHQDALVPATSSTHGSGVDEFDAFSSTSKTADDFGALSSSSADHWEEYGTEVCSCSPDDDDSFDGEDEEEVAVMSGASVADLMMLRQQQLRRRREKKLEKLRRKAAKREKMSRKMARKMNTKKADHCKADVKMNCFSHDNDHWKTPPLWTDGPFCACTNSNNNTYWCVRNINTTHNYLYCEYVTGMVTYFNLGIDPHQLRNLLHTLEDSEINFMHSQVSYLREYSAANEYLKSSMAASEEERRVAAEVPLTIRSAPHLQKSLNLASRDSRLLPWTPHTAATAAVQDLKLDKHKRKTSRRQLRQRSKKQHKKQQQLKKRIRNLLKIHNTADYNNNRNDPTALMLAANVNNYGGNDRPAASTPLSRLQRRLLRSERQQHNRRQRRNRRKLKQPIGDEDIRD